MLSAARAAPTRSLTTLEDPPGAMETPYKQSAASIVRFWWLTITN